MPQVTRALAPASVVYPQHVTLNHVRHTEPASTIFVWFTLPRRTRAPAGAKYAVLFDIETSPGYGTSDLAWMLLRFADYYGLLSPTPFKLLALSYYLSSTSVTGALVYNEDLFPIYSIMMQKALNSPHLFSCPITAAPLSAWPYSTYNFIALFDYQRLRRTLSITR
ncbi:hypothetical protein HWV62_13603 [Athelia sp. TMB]|nr:hypothetical protein HWV62_13603 [Athelia sp. TMB]